jgi:hypothetical protein
MHGSGDPSARPSSWRAPAVVKKTAEAYGFGPDLLGMVVQILDCLAFRSRGTAKFVEAPSRIKPEVPKMLDQIILTALAKDTPTPRPPF